MKSIYTIIAIIVIIFLTLSIYIFTKFADTSKLLYAIAIFLLMSALALGLWLQFFSKMQPLRLSITLTSITVFSVLISLYLLHIFDISQAYSTPIGIAIGHTVGNLLNKKISSLEKIFKKLLKL